MEAWINRVLMGSGIATGLLLATGHTGEGLALALLGMFAVWRMRTGAPESPEL